MREHKNSNTASGQQMGSRDRQRMGNQKTRESVVERLVLFILRP